MKSLLSLIGLSSIIVLAGCSSPEKVSRSTNASTTALYQAKAEYCEDKNQSTISFNQGDFWSSCFEHNNTTLDFALNKIDGAIAANIDEQLNHFLYYLRAHYYFADLSLVSDSQWLNLHRILLKLSTQLDTVSNSQLARIEEHLYTLIYLYYPSTESKEVLAVKLVDYLPFWRASLSRIANSSSKLNQAEQYRLLELYRHFASLSYYAVNNKAIKSTLLAEDLIVSTLSKLIKANQQDDWQLQHQLWLAAQLHILLAEDKQKSLDQLVKAKLFDSELFSNTRAKVLFSQTYLANSLRTTDHCNDEFKGYCEIPSIDEVLPVNHECSASIVIRATQMTRQQLSKSCEGLLAQEGFFHQQVDSKLIPVTGDKNSQLRVVIFDNYTEYNRWGQLVFNIFTNNGGMYIEGEPEIVGNQATFYSFEAYWQQPEFAVWNLAHEYVHYLDGRFVKKGSFGYFPEQLVWWSEGLAEYIAKQDNNDRALKLLAKTDQKDWPTLKEVFSTVYADGSDRVYQWSYFAQRFLFTHHIEQSRAMASHLKNDDFAGYQQVMAEVAQSAQADFQSWLAKVLVAYKKQAADNKSTVEEKQAKYLYRYLYRNDLRPTHLPITQAHFHFENWG